MSPNLRTSAQVELIKEIVAINPGVSHIHWINPEGRIIASSLSEAIGQARRDQLFFVKLFPERSGA